MAYVFRVSLSGIKGFARVYHLDPSMTLYELHKRLRDDLDLPHDQLIQFKALDSEGGLVARYGLFDLGGGTVDRVSLADVRDRGICSFVYFYDVTNRKNLIVSFESEEENEPYETLPYLSESKGPNPIDFENGYVAFEDLPEKEKLIKEDASWNKDKGDESFDDFEDDEDEDEDEEEEEEIYDENEAAL